MFSLSIYIFSQDLAIKNTILPEVYLYLYLFSVSSTTFLADKGTPGELASLLMDVKPKLILRTNT